MRAGPEANATVEDLIRIFDLRPHPEGGYFSETYRDERVLKRSALPQLFGGDRSISTAIYYLLPRGAVSKLHRLKSDEIFHFYLGGPMTVAQISSEGRVTKTVLGQSVNEGQKLQHVIPAGCWFGAYPNAGSEYSLIGCTVAPGFDFADFELGDKRGLLQRFPHAEEVIQMLGHDS